MTLPRKNMCMGELQLGCRGRKSSVSPFTVWFYLWMTAKLFVASDVSRKSRNCSSVFCVDKTYSGCGRRIGRRLDIKSKILMLSWKEIWWKFQIYFHFFSIALFSSFSSAFASSSSSPSSFCCFSFSPPPPPPPLLLSGSQIPNYNFRLHFTLALVLISVPTPSLRESIEEDKGEERRKKEKEKKDEKMGEEWVEIKKKKVEERSAGERRRG